MVAAIAASPMFVTRGMAAHALTRVTNIRFATLIRFVIGCVCVGGVFLISASLTNGVSFQMKEFASLQWKKFAPFRAKCFALINLFWRILPSGEANRKSQMLVLS